MPGWLTSSRTKIGRKDKGKSDALNQLIRHGREEKRWMTELELQMNVPRSKQYNRMFQ